MCYRQTLRGQSCSVDAKLAAYEGLFALFGWKGDEVVGSPKPQYSHGAIPEVREPFLLNLLEDLHSSVPISEKHRELFREVGCEFIFCREIDEPSGWLVLVRFGSVLESRFGFTREIPIFYSPFSDLWVSSTDGIAARLREYLPKERASISSHVMFVWAPDSNLVTKLEDWSEASRLLVALPDEDAVDHPDHLQRFINALAQRFVSRDLYAVRSYVTGSEFFGRASELQQVADCIARGEIVGVFGLRKTGKTSLLKQLKVAYGSERDPSNRLQLLVYQDLEFLPSLIEDPVTELIQDLSTAITRELRNHGLPTKELEAIRTGSSPSDFGRALSLQLDEIKDQAKIVLMLDEIEHLCPPNPGPDTSGRGFQHVRQLFGNLRKIVQEQTNFAFVMAGLSSSAIEESELYGSPNPFFLFARPLYLGPFDIDEGEELLNTLGRKLGIHWDSGSVELAHDLSGGHVLLLRELASKVWAKQKHGRTNTAQIKKGTVHKAVPEWRKDVAHQVREVLPHLRRYFPDAADLAVMLLDDPDSFRDFAESFGDSVDRLVKLGIVEHGPSGAFTATPLLRFSHEFAKRETSGGDEVQIEPTLSTTSIDELLAQEESDSLERKESLRAHEVPEGANPKKFDEKIVDQVLKACLGFLNANGGSVIVGQADEGAVIGIQRDLDKCGGLDGLLRFLSDKIRSRIGNEGILLISLDTPLVGDKTLLVLRVTPSPTPVFPASAVDDKTGLFVRHNNTTVVLNNGAALDYSAIRWPNS